MNRKMGMFFFFLFLFSRLLFLNSQAVFFDSQEYLTRLTNPDFFQSLASGHLAFHAGYIFIFWPIFQIAKFINLNPASAVVFFQIILSYLSIYCFYQLIKIIFNQKIAFLSAIIVSLTPLYWITNITIMMETTYVSFFIFSLYFWIKYYFSKKSESYYLILSLVFFVISFLTHIVIFLWLPVFLFLVFYFQKKISFKSVVNLSLFLFIAVSINAYLISSALKINFFQSLSLIYTHQLSDRVNVINVLVYLRNFIIPLLRNNTNLIILFGFLGLIKLYFKNKKIFFIFLFWVLPALIANQWWDSLFFGRHALIASFAFSFLTAFLIYKNKSAVILLSIYLLIVSLSALYLLKQEIPYLEEAEAVKTLPQNGMLIESHFARPQVAGTYRGESIFIDSAISGNKELKGLVQKNLDEKKPVFISSQALSDPYGLYSGPYLHALALSYKNQPAIKEIMENFTLLEYKAINREDNLIIYKIISDKPSTYPVIKSMKYERRRLDYFDPISRIWFYFNKKLSS